MPSSKAGFFGEKSMPTLAPRRLRAVKPGPSAAGKLFQINLCGKFRMSVSHRPQERRKRRRQYSRNDEQIDESPEGDLDSMLSGILFARRCPFVPLALDFPSRQTKSKVGRADDAANGEALERGYKKSFDKRVHTVGPQPHALEDHVRHVDRNNDMWHECGEVESAMANRFGEKAK